MAASIPKPKKNQPTPRKLAKIESTSSYLLFTRYTASKVEIHVSPSWKFMSSLYIHLNTQTANRQPPFRPAAAHTRTYGADQPRHTCIDTSAHKQLASPHAREKAHRMKRSATVDKIRGRVNGCVWGSAHSKRTLIFTIST